MNALNHQPIIEDFKKNKILCVEPYNGSSPYKPQILNFHGTDDEETFNQSLKQMPEDWHYRNKKIEYRTNSYGYRTVEFSQAKWKDSVVLFGCSNAFGIGLAEDETLAHFITVKTGRPVVNLGAPGSSMMFSYINSLTLRNGYPRPAAVINLWTSFERISHFTRTNVTHHGVWKNTPEFRAWNQNDTNPLIYALMIQASCKVVWGEYTQYYEGSFFKHTSDALTCAHFPFLDFARDRKHPGPKGNEQAADHIIQNLQL